MIDSNDGGANVSVNGGRTWTAQTFSTAQMYHVVTTAHIPYQVCGAQQDNTTLCVPSDGRGASFYPVGGGESGYVAADPRIPIFFTPAASAASSPGSTTRPISAARSTCGPNIPVGQSAEDLKERFQWTTPILFSPADPKILYASSQHLLRPPIKANPGLRSALISRGTTRPR